MRVLVQIIGAPAWANGRQFTRKDLNQQLERFDQPRPQLQLAA
jgi:hypothetical protein